MASVLVVSGVLIVSGVLVMAAMLVMVGMLATSGVIAGPRVRVVSGARDRSRVRVLSGVKAVPGIRVVANAGGSADLVSGRRLRRGCTVARTLTVPGIHVVVRMMVLVRDVGVPRRLTMRVMPIFRRHRFMGRVLADRAGPS